MSAVSFTRLLAASSCLLLCACSETVVKDAPGTTNEQISDAIQSSDPLGNHQTEEPSPNSIVTIPAAATTDIDTNEPGNLTDTDNLPTTDSDNTTAGSSDTGQPSTPTSINQTTIPAIPDQAPTTVNPTDQLSDPITDSSDVNPDITPVNVPDINPDVTPANVPDINTESIAVPEPTATPVVQPQQPATEMIVGEPGSVVDCQQRLPCRWISEDTQFFVTVTNSDNIASRGRLSIEFSIGANHDTQVSIARSEPAFDATGTQFEPVDQMLGSGNGGTPQQIIAGDVVQGALSFDKASTSDNVAQWSIRIIDGGIVRDAIFENLYIGSITTEYADCDNILPCIWASPDSSVTITLLSAGGLLTGNRLSASFSINSTSNQSIALDSGASGVGIDGTQFIARTHVLGDKDGHEKIVANAIAGAPLFGIVNFFRTPVLPDSLQDLSLILYQDQPVPRWNPKFTAVPIE